MKQRSARRRSVPLVLQSEAAECGLACVAMVAGYWGCEVDLPAMRRRGSFSLRGATLLDLIRIAERVRLVARPLRVELQSLEGLATPCILHWDMDHFVVLCKVRAGRVMLHDPAIGRRCLTLAQVGESFTGVALELRPAEGFERSREKSRVAFRELVGAVPGIGRSLGHVLALAAAIELLAILSPMLLQRVVDGAIRHTDGGLLATLGLGLALLALLHGSLAAARGWTTTALSTNLAVALQTNLFAHLLRLPLPWFEKRWAGETISRFHSADMIQRTLTTGSIEVVADGVMGMIVLVVMAAYSLPLAGAAASGAALYALFRQLGLNRLRALTCEELVRAARQQTHLMETLRGMPALKLFGAEAQRRSRWLNLLVDVFNARAEVERLDASLRGAKLAVLGVTSGVVVWLGAWMVLRGAFSLGMLFAFLAYKDQFDGRVGALVDRIFTFRLLGVQTERLADVLLEPPEASPDELAIAAEQRSASIEITSLSFRYSDADPWVIRDLDLRVEPGECVAIVGPSGCGKSTVVKLIAGLLVPTHGSVRVAGVPAASQRAAGGRALGVVLQDDLIFSGTIAENIHFFSDDPDMAKVKECAHLAALDGDIEQMPMGYGTLVGEGGGALSGGQKQRLLIARALHVSPSILVLDEATSHLDLETERVVTDSIRCLRLARLIVAHRPETARAADRVVSLAPQLKAGQPNADTSSGDGLSPEAQPSSCWVSHVKEVSP